MFDGIGPFSGARFLLAWVASESTVSLGFAIMSVSMFDLATSHNGEGLFWFGWSLRFQ
jgi:predicted cobalt transporter CbtA